MWTNKPLTGSYRTALEQSPPGALSIPRADVADLMLRSLAKPETSGHAVGIGS